MRVERELRITVTGYTLNKVTDEDVTLPSPAAGEYKRVIDHTKTGELMSVEEWLRQKGRSP